MVTETDFPAWIILLFGIYSVAASLGEMLRPGFWVSMIDELAGSSALRFLTGIVLIALGGAIYLIGPWNFEDWMQVLVKAVGAWMVIEGALFLAIGDRFIGFGKAVMSKATGLWAGLSLLIGIAFIAAALLRI